MNDIKSILMQIAKELHTTVRKPKEFRKVKVSGLNEVWAIDLVDMQEWEEDNEGYKYMLTVIDVFSRYAWAEPLRTKSAQEVLQAFKKIIKESKVKPSKIWADKGSEFYNTSFKKYLNDNNITLYSTYSEQKAVPVERFNRTLKSKMWLQFSAKNTRVWIDMLPDLMDSYNTTKHSSINMTPKQAQQKVNEEDIFDDLYDDKPVYDEGKFKLGDRVRIARVKGKFEKGFHDNFSRELFTIYEIDHRKPVMYRLKDMANEPIEGSFYEAELLKTQVPDIVLIEEVISTRKHNGKKQLLVKYLGYPDTFNTWIDADTTTKL